MAEWELPGLFLHAFLAATLLPLPSEGTLAALALSGNHAVGALWLWATVGNTAGALLNWALGRWLLAVGERAAWSPVTAEALARARGRLARWGTWTLLLAWVPIIGDPITFAAGLLRVRFPLFFILVLLGKGARYGVLLGLLEGVGGDGAG